MTETLRKVVDSYFSLVPNTIISRIELMTSVQFNHEVTVLKPVWVPLQSNWNGRSAE